MSPAGPAPMMATGVCEESELDGVPIVMPLSTKIGRDC